MKFASKVNLFLPILIISSSIHCVTSSAIPLNVLASALKKQFQANESGKSLQDITKQYFTKSNVGKMIEGSTWTFLEDLIGPIEIFKVFSSDDPEPIIGPLNDPIPLPPLSLQFDEESGVKKWINGSMLFCNVGLAGGSSLWYQMDIRVHLENQEGGSFIEGAGPSATVKLQLATEEIGIRGHQDINVVADLPIGGLAGSFTSNTDFRAILTQLYLSLEFELNVLRTFNARNFDIKFDPPQFDLHFSNSGLSDEQWKSLSDRITKLIAQILAIEIPHPIPILPPLSLEEIIEDYLLPGLVNGPDGKYGPFSGCFPYVMALGDLSCIERAAANMANAPPPSNPIAQLLGEIDIMEIINTLLDSIGTLHSELANIPSQICPLQ